ncbi:hypothetical protein BGX27_008307 [Mortierella sp. AM989]|nr:hypothetical protein BGX27_008307 [Mortierella sp. AM989]
MTLWFSIKTHGVLKSCRHLRYVTYPTYREAAQARRLLKDDNEWGCYRSNPCKLWTQVSHDMSEDFLKKAKNRGFSLSDPDVIVQAAHCALHEIAKFSLA